MANVDLARWQFAFVTINGAPLAMGLAAFYQPLGKLIKKAGNPWVRP
jgi:hypothetical protein